MLLFVDCNSLIELLLPNVAPWADGVANNLNVEFRHLAQRWSEHTIDVGVLTVLKIRTAAGQRLVDNV